MDIEIFIRLGCILSICEILLLFFVLVKVFGKKNKTAENSPYPGGNTKLNTETKYNDNSDKILLGIINEELQKYGKDINKCVTRNQRITQIVLDVITLVLIGVAVTSYFLKYDTIRVILIIFITCLIYIKMNKKMTFNKELLTKVKINPHRGIADIVYEEISECVEVPVKRGYVLSGIIAISVILPCIYFAKPIITFDEVEGVTRVANCTRSVLDTKEIIIPTSYEGHPVTVIADNAFKETTFRTVVIPDGIEVVNEGAFKDCLFLKSVIVSSTVKTINSEAFLGCISLKNIEFSRGLTEVKSRAFMNCKKLEYIKLPESLEYIGAGAFYGCKSLKKITVPPLVTEINGVTFTNCSSLEEVNLPYGIKIKSNAIKEKHVRINYY